MLGEVIEDSLILKGDRLLIPEALRSQVLAAVRTGHQGGTRCLVLARETVFGQVLQIISNS